MYFIGYGCSFIAGDASFRKAWGTQFVPAVVLMVDIPFLPRSPRRLAKVGRVDKAVEVLAHIQAGGRKDDPLVIAEWEEITTILAAEREAPYSAWRRFVTNGMWRRTFAGMSIQAWQQVSGANVCRQRTSSQVQMRPVLTLSSISYDVLRCVRIPDGLSYGQHQFNFIWRPVCAFHHLYINCLFLHRQDWRTTAVDLRSNRHGHLPVRCWRCSGKLRKLC